MTADRPTAHLISTWDWSSPVSDWVEAIGTGGALLIAAVVYLEGLRERRRTRYLAARRQARQVHMNDPTITARTGGTVRGLAFDATLTATNNSDDELRDAKVRLVLDTTVDLVVPRSTPEAVYATNLVPEGDDISVNLSLLVTDLVVVDPTDSDRNANLWWEVRFTDPQGYRWVRYSNGATEDVTGWRRRRVPEVPPSLPRDPDADR